MAMGKKRWRQEPMWIANQELPGSRGLVFYDRVNEILKSEKFSYVHTGEVWLLVSMDTTVPFRTVTATHPPTTPRLTVEERAEDCGVPRSTQAQTGPTVTLKWGTVGCFALRTTDFEPSTLSD